MGLEVTVVYKIKNFFDQECIDEIGNGNVREAYMKVAEDDHPLNFTDDWHIEDVKFIPDGSDNKIGITED